MLTLRSLILTKSIARNAAVLSRSYQSGGHQMQTMNDLPVPEGDFYELKAKRNRKYNSFLIAGVVSLGFTLFVVKESGALHFNYSPPDSV